MKIFMYCSVLLIIVGACSNNHYNTDLAKVSEEFSPKLLAHFPEDIKGSYKIKAYLPAACLYEDSKRCGVLLVVSSREVPINILKEKSVQNVKINDKNNLVVDKPTYNNLTPSDKLSYPIPDFATLLKDEYWKESSSNDSIVIINNRLNIYIIESKKGKYLDEKYLKNNIHMPIGWEHGFSRGIAINEESELTIFWLEVW